MAQWHLSWHWHSRAVMPMVGGEGRCWLPVLMGCLVPVLLSPIPTGCPEPGAWLSSAPGPHYCAVAWLDHHVWRLRGGSGGECPIFGVGTKCKGRVALACAVLRGAGPACSGGAVVLQHPCGEQGSTGWRSGVRVRVTVHPPLFPQPREKGRMRFHKLQNVQIALNYLKHRQVRWGCSIAVTRGHPPGPCRAPSPRHSCRVLGPHR